ncbi:MAG: energy-coupling factor ABC transporter permease [Gammaproteobacteria bacterium]|nr:energy-coupling factor ABC transporter permease [Gammaproteobacteria bacterium]
MTIESLMLTLSTGILFVALLRAPWINFRDAGFQHVFFGSCVAAFFLWLLRAGIVPEIPIHLLCLTTLTLMFGAPLAIIAAATLSIAMCLAGIETWQSLPLAFLAYGVVPVFISWAMFVASRRYLPPNPFIYIFVCAFFGAAASMLAAVVVNSALLVGSDQVSLVQLQESYLLILPLLMFPEAFINGMLVTGLVAFKPNWIPSFDDRIYLKG